MVCYFDSWVNANWDSLTNFFQRGGRVRIILPDTNIPEVMKWVSTTFHTHSEPELKRKIDDTIKGLFSADRSKTKTEIYLLKTSPNYAAILVDEAYIFLSPYEHNLAFKVSSPSLRINISNSKKLRDHWKGEFSWLISNSQLINR